MAACLLSACDQDGDGYDSSVDCDDTDPAVYPGAPEVSDGIDNDCDGAVDEAMTLPVWARLTGEGAGHQAGREVALGDVDGDGRADVLVFAPYFSSSTAAAAVYLELAAGLEQGTSGLENVRATYLGSPLSANYSGLGSGGDLDGDGFDELSIGHASNPDAGELLVIPGRAAGDWPDSDTLSPELPAPAWLDGYYGMPTSLRGDLNGDGVSDLATGAPFNDIGGGGPDAYKGRIYLEFGAPGLSSIDLTGVSMLGEVAGDQAGAALALVPDMDGDGDDELIVGAPYGDRAIKDSGQVYLVLGRAGGWPSSGLIANEASAVLTGNAANSRVGSVLASAGDVNGDGRGDFLVGAPQESTLSGGAGAVWLVLGGSVRGTLPITTAAATVILGDAAGDRAGAALAGGDVNGDGLSDLVVGAPAHDGGGVDAGIVAVFYGRSGTWPTTLQLADADISFVGEAAGDLAGSSIAAGQVVGGGSSDLLVGAPGYSREAAGQGAAYLLSGL